MAQRAPNWIRELSLALRDYYGDNGRRPHSITVNPDILKTMRESDLDREWIETGLTGAETFARLPIVADPSVKTFKLEK